MKRRPWFRRWQIVLGGTTVRGVSHCASSAGENNTNYTDLTVSSDADSNIYRYAVLLCRLCQNGCLVWSLPAW